MSEKINISNLFTVTSYQILDVRSPSEFKKGHIPNAINLPLFNDAERAAVGTTYKKESQDAAILEGLDIVGPKMSNFIRNARAVSKDNKVLIHCWRGGKRSQSMAWLLGMSGMDVKVLESGYKAYRQFIRKDFLRIKNPFIILTGSTGSGKTKILHELKKQGEQILDLEKLANHKGSAFGDIGELPQPSTEQFENNLYHIFKELDFNKRVWLESESRMIGNIPLPDTFWKMMYESPMVHVNVSRKARIKYLVNNYGKYPKSELIESFEKLKKKLAQNLAIAKEALENNDLELAANIALDYYDKYYNRHLEKNKNRIKEILQFEEMDFNFMCDELQKLNIV